MVVVLNTFEHIPGIKKDTKNLKKANLLSPQESEDLEKKIQATGLPLDWVRDRRVYFPNRSKNVYDLVVHEKICASKE